MSDSISRQAAIDGFYEMASDMDHLCTVSDYVSFLESLPSAQPEIIQCKDCKHRPFDSEDTQGFGVEFPDEMCPCQCDDGWYNWRPNDDWFCANAERRDDD